MKLSKFAKFSAVLFIAHLILFTLSCKQESETSAAGNEPPQIISVEKPKIYQIDPQTLPEPFASESASRSSKIVARPKDAKFYLPPGFKVNVFADDNFKNPRWLTLAPNGDVFLADSAANSVIILRDTNKDGIADQRFIFSDKLSQPFGMGFNGGYFYVANTDSVVRFKYRDGQTAAENEPEKVITLTEGGYNRPLA